MIQKRNRFSTNSQKSKKIALDFQPLANPKIENMKRRFFSENLRVFLGFSNLAVPARGFTSFRGTFLRSESVPTSIFRQIG